MIDLELLNSTKQKISKRYVNRMLNQILSETSVKERVSLSVVFLGEKRMQNLNRDYHGQDVSTDVLSFSTNEDFPYRQINGKFIGEVFVCPGVVKRNASKMGLPYDRELAHVIIHGVLHLLGHEHESSLKKHKEMHGLEERIMNKLGV